MLYNEEVRISAGIERQLASRADQRVTWFERVKPSDQRVTDQMVWSRGENG